MSEFDQLYEQMRELYEGAFSKREMLEQELEKVNETIEKLGTLFSNTPSKNYTFKDLQAGETRQSGRRVVKEAKKEVGVKRAGRGEKAAHVAKGERSKNRIKEEVVREAILGILREAQPETRSGKELFDELAKQGLPSTASFHTRVYSLLTRWSKMGLVNKVGRGSYGLGNLDKK